jgi:hypothetical protein
MASVQRETLAIEIVRECYLKTNGFAGQADVTKKRKICLLDLAGLLRSTVLSKSLFLLCPYIKSVLFLPIDHI